MPAAKTCLLGIVLPLVVYSAATLYLTWPLPSTAASAIWKGGRGMFAQRYRADMLLMIWILRWDLHALATNPLGLFDANIFHPAPRTLATTEHLLGQLPLYAPAFLLSGNPVLAFNLVMLASFVLAAFFMHILVFAWTRSAAASYAAGLAFAFAPWRLSNGLGRTHLLQVQYFPLLLLLLDRAASTGLLRWSLLAALVLAIQTLCTYYAGYQAFAIALIFAGAMLVNGELGRREIAAVALTFAFALLVVVPLTVPYLLNRATGTLGFEWTENAQMFAERAGKLGHVLSVYVGAGTLMVASLALLGLPLFRSSRRIKARVASLAAIVVVALLLARGPTPLFFESFVPWDWLAKVVPGLQNFRAPARFGSMVSFGMAGLAGLAVAGMQTLLRRWRAGSTIELVAAGAALLVILMPTAERPDLRAWPVPVGSEVPAAYRWLAAHGEGRPLLELPIPSTLREASMPALAMYFSTYHWLPLLNGYSGYAPQSYPFLMNYAEQLPNAEALRLLVDCTGLRWILLHRPSRARLEGWQAMPGIRLVGGFPREDGGRDALIEVTEPASDGCRERLLQQKATADGNAVALLSQLRGALTVEGLPEQVPADRELTVTVRLENVGSEVWPCTSLVPERAFVLAESWGAASGGAAVLTAETVLPRDVAAGERREFVVRLHAPSQTGEYSLTVVAGQLQASDEAPKLRWSRAVEVVAASRLAG